MYVARCFLKKKNRQFLALLKKKNTLCGSNIYNIINKFINHNAIKVTILNREIKILISQFMNKST